MSERYYQRFLLIAFGRGLERGSHRIIYTLCSEILLVQEGE